MYRKTTRGVFLVHFWGCVASFLVHFGSFFWYVAGGGNILEGLLVHFLEDLKSFFGTFRGGVWYIPGGGGTFLVDYIILLGEFMVLLGGFCGATKGFVIQFRGFQIHIWDFQHVLSGQFLFFF